jgi:hypothetical protein
MMAPHHGGDEYLESIPFDFMQNVYAQNSRTNNHGHPGQQTIKYLENWGINFINVQEY